MGFKKASILFIFLSLFLQPLMAEVHPCDHELLQTSITLKDHQLALSENGQWKVGSEALDAILEIALQGRLGEFGYNSISFLIIPNTHPGMEYFTQEREHGGQLIVRLNNKESRHLLELFHRWREKEGVYKDHFESLFVSAHHPRLYFFSRAELITSKAHRDFQKDVSRLLTFDGAESRSLNFPQRFIGHIRPLAIDPSGGTLFLSRQHVSQVETLELKSGKTKTVWEPKTSAGTVLSMGLFEDGKAWVIETDSRYFVEIKVWFLKKRFSIVKEPGVFVKYRSSQLVIEKNKQSLLLQPGQLFGKEWTWEELRQFASP